ncbi:hypothetical protein APHAL10511_007228 [Amanita phalloides]|nr:hypothetical protein APHAL10511_007228 [Amanita phalloides]
MSTGEQGKDPARVAAGLKAAVHNPRVSEEAKENASERLHQMHVETAEDTSKTRRKTSKSPSRRERSKSREELIEGKSESRVMGGYKATLKNPRVSEEAKEHAEEVLEQHHVAH